MTGFEQCTILSFQPTEVINNKLKEGWLVKIAVPVKKKYSEDDAVLIVFEREVSKEKGESQ